MTHQYISAQAESQNFAVLLFPDAEADANDFLPIGRAVAPKAALLSLSGLAVPTSFQQAADAAALLAQQYCQNCVSGGVGYSEGASALALLMATYPDLLSGAVLLRPRLLLPQESFSGKMPGKQILILAGSEDPVSTTAETEQFARMLSQAGALVEVRWAENGGHEMTPRDFQAAREFFTRLFVNA